MRPVRVMMFALAAPAAGIVFSPPGLRARSLRTPAPTAAATFRTTTPRKFENNNAYANENMQALLTPTSFKRGPRSLLDNMARTCGYGLGGAIILAVNLVDMLGGLVAHGPPYIEVGVRFRLGGRDVRRGRAQRLPLRAHPMTTNGP